MGAVEDIPSILQSTHRSSSDALYKCAAKERALMINSLVKENVMSYWHEWREQEPPPKVMILYEYHRLNAVRVNHPETKQTIDLYCKLIVGDVDDLADLDDILEQDLIEEYLRLHEQEQFAKMAGQKSRAFYKEAKKQLDYADLWGLDVGAIAIDYGLWAQGVAK